MKEHNDIDKNII